jgi:hypothetical protein
MPLLLWRTCSRVTNTPSNGLTSNVTEQGASQQHTGEGSHGVLPHQTPLHLLWWVSVLLNRQPVQYHRSDTVSICKGADGKSAQLYLQRELVALLMRADQCAEHVQMQVCWHSATSVARRGRLPEGRCARTFAQVRQTRVATDALLHHATKVHSDKTLRARCILICARSPAAHHVRGSEACCDRDCPAAMLKRRFQISWGCTLGHICFLHPGTVKQGTAVLGGCHPILHHNSSATI